MTKKLATALILGGGGSKGAVQAGFLRAIERSGIDVNLIIAASIGAVNGAFVAAGVPARDMVSEWARVRRRDLFSLNWNMLRRPASASSIYSARRLRKFLEARLPTRLFEDLSIPLIVVTTDLASGEPYFWESGDLIEAILASTAVPGLLPPSRGPQGQLLIDGSLSDNVPVDAAFERGADRVIGMLCRTCATCKPRDLGLVTMLGQAFGIAVDAKWRIDARRYVDRRDVLIIEPEIGLDVPSLDFSRGAELWRAGYRLSRAALRRWLVEAAGGEADDASAVVGAGD